MHIRGGDAAVKGTVQKKTTKTTTELCYSTVFPKTPKTS